MTYNDYIEIDGKNVASVDFGEKIFDAVKQITEIFKLKNYCLIRKGSVKNIISRNTEKTQTPYIAYRDTEDFINQIKNSYRFNTYVYYSDTA